MPKILWKVKYSSEGAKGVLKDGGSKRKAVVEELLRAHGGRLECFYFAFGDDDAYLIADVPSNTEAAATAMVVGASGAAQLSTTVLLTPEEIDAAAKVSLDYRPPGT